MINIQTTPIKIYDNGKLTRQSKRELKRAYRRAQFAYYRALICRNRAVMFVSGVIFVTLVVAMAPAWVVPFGVYVTYKRAQSAPSYPQEQQPAERQKRDRQGRFS